MKKFFLLLFSFTLHIQSTFTWNLPLPFNISIEIPNQFKPTDEQKFLEYLKNNAPQKTSFIFSPEGKAETDSFEKIGLFILPNSTGKSAEILAAMMIDYYKSDFLAKMFAYSTKNMNTFNAASFKIIIGASESEETIISFTFYVNKDKVVFLQHSVEITEDCNEEEALNRIFALIALNPEYLNF